MTWRVTYRTTAGSIGYLTVRAATNRRAALSARLKLTSLGYAKASIIGVNRL